MNQLERKLYGEINELRNRSKEEIMAILKARDDLKNSIDYMLLLVREMCRKEEQKLRMIEALNPHQGKDFIDSNLINTGYPLLIEVLENLSSDALAEKQKKYWVKVDKEFERLKERFLKVFEKSGDNATLTGYDGWQFVRKFFPLIITQKSIKQFGFIYVSALDNILSAMNGLRIFDRFGFDLPVEFRSKRPKNAKVLFDFENGDTAQKLRTG